MVILSSLANEFKLLDYSCSHRRLLIRSMRNKIRNYNIDIQFGGVKNLFIPATLKGVEISLYSPGPEEFNGFRIREMEFTYEHGYKIFSIRDIGGNEYLINAFGFGVYRCPLDILETSLGRYDSTDPTDYSDEEIFWYP